MVSALHDICDAAAGGDGRLTATDRTRLWVLRELERGRFAPGDSVRESLLARECGVNRNSLREALNHLVGADLLEYQSYCGYRIREYTLRDLLEWYELREAVEPVAARRLARARPPAVLAELDASIAAMEADFAEGKDAARKDDMDFHLALLRGCGSRSLARLEIVCRVTSAFFRYSDELRYRMPSTLRYFDHVPARGEFDECDRRFTMEKHREIYNAIARGDVRAAERSAREHVASQVENLESLPPEMLSIPLREAGRSKDEKEAPGRMP